MLQVYLPVAEMSVHVLVILALGGATGLLSGLFGVGGGFLTTPLLIFLGVPPTVSVATSANQIVASSISGFLTHWRRSNVDFYIGNLLLLGGIVGSSVGIWLFGVLKNLGQIDLTISLLYVFFLGFIGLSMGRDSLRSLSKNKNPVPRTTVYTTPRWKRWIARLPWQTHFAKSDIRISRWLPVMVGFGVGVLVSVMGIGGGFFMIPAMIYILGMPTAMVVGTSLYQIIFITAHVTLMHAISTHSVDIMLALVLISGSVIGAQVGSRWGSRLPAAHLRGLLALLVLAVCLRMAYGLFVTPPDIYSLEALP